MKPTPGPLTEHARRSFIDLGFAIVPGVMQLADIASLRKAVEEFSDSSSTRTRGGVFALRNLLDASSGVRAFSGSRAIRALVEPVLGCGCFPVRGILFDKIPTANWKVPFHRDVTIAVQEKVDVEGFGPWSVKAGVLHTQPPVSVLESMMSVRLHLDDCSEMNGALRVLPGSHRLGRISEAAVESVRRRSQEHVCEVAAGGALLMRPLLLHSSSPSKVPGHRRVIHLDFASHPLPAGLKWLGAPS